MRYAAFLRGMNLGKRRIQNTELCAAFEEIGLEKPAAFLASGNVVFESKARSLPRLRERIESGLEETLGYAVPTFLRTGDQVRALAEVAPFSPARGVKNGKVQVTLLADAPTPAAKRDVLALATDDDQLAFGDRALFWLPTGGLSDSVLDLKEIRKRLGEGTTRTQNTLARMAKKFF